MTDPADPIVGLDLDAAVEAISDREVDVEPGTVWSTLETVADDGVVTQRTIDSAVGEAAQYVATPENRLDLVDDARKSARAAAEPALHLDVVETRFDQLDERYRGLAVDLDDLLDRLDCLIEDARAPANVLDIARRVKDLRWSARDLHGRVEDLRADFESFERWASDPETRATELEADAESVENRLDAIEETASELETADAPIGGEDWAAAVVDHRVTALLLEDIAHERAALADWPDTDSNPTLGDRLARLRERHQALENRLEAVGRPTWWDRHGGSLDALQAELSSFEPPIQWGAVAPLIEEHTPGRRVGN